MNLAGHQLISVLSQFFLGKLCVFMSPPFSKVPLWIFGQGTIIKVVIMTLSEGQVNNDRIALDTEGK